MPTTEKTTQAEPASLTEKASSIAHEAVNVVADHAMAAEQTIRSAAANSADTLTDSRETAQLQFESSIARSRVWVAENPLTAAGLAFMAGVVISGFLQKRS